ERQPHPARRCRPGSVQARTRQGLARGKELASADRAMDWLSEWEPGPYMSIEQVDPPADAGRLTAWLVLVIAAGVIAALWYRQRVFRHSFGARLPDATSTYACGSGVSCPARRSRIPRGSRATVAVTIGAFAPSGRGPRGPLGS